MKFEHELFCSFCKEMFDIYEDFKNHLRLEHNVDKNVDNIVQSEMKKAGHPIIEIIKSEVVEEVIIDDDSDIEMTGEVTDIKEGSSFSEDFEEKVQSIAMSTAKKLFENIRNITDEDYNSTDEKYANIQDTEDDVFYSEKSISSFFDRMRSKIKQIDFSDVVLENLDSSNDTKKKECPKVVVMKNNIKEDVKTEKVQNVQTLYFCPLQGCSFSTTKEKIKDDSAILKHLTKDHGIKKEDIKRNLAEEPRIYTFIKIKKSM